MGIVDGETLAITSVQLLLSLYKYFYLMLAYTKVAHTLIQKWVPRLYKSGLQNNR